ncbi:hypothetical protein [Moheibacter lacus]|uniref:hypothetical protein n=1 Tax=Moheibacter lacus TaxID=2745851 RepID=UPI001C70FE5A|nr:hypothetical protein [Moheibacter lacus]
MKDSSHKELPIFIKAIEISEIIHRFVKTLDGDQQEFLDFQIALLLENAILIPAKIAGAEGADIYDIRMENAAIIRKAAREIYVSVGALEIFGIEGEQDYIQLIRNEIEEFKILFRNWVKTFDPWHYILDDWGLFNPPGVEPE